MILGFRLKHSKVINRYLDIFSKFKMLILFILFQERDEKKERKKEKKTRVKKNGARIYAYCARAKGL